MKRFIFYAALVLVLGAVIMEAMRHDPGYLLIRLGEHALETTFWFAFLALVAVVFCMLAIFFSVSKILSLFNNGITSISERKERRIEKKTNKGLINYIEGNWQAARKDLVGVAKSAEQPLVHYLAAAQSAYEMGDKEESYRLLNEAEKNAPEDDLAVGISQARIQLLDAKHEQCLATLQRIYDDSKPHPVVLDLLKQVLWEVKDWHALKTLLPELKSSKVNYDIENLELQINIQLLKEKINLINASKNTTYADTKLIAGATLNSDENFADQDLSNLKTFWQKLSKKQRSELSLIELYTNQLALMSQYKECAQLIQRTLKREWSENLLKQYASLRGGDFARQLKIAEEWSQSKPGDSFLLHMLGRIAVKNELWGKAKEYFEESLKVKETSSAYADYGLLMAKLGEHVRSTELYEKGLFSGGLKHPLNNLCRGDV